jgi:hypothetical protein
MSNELKQTMEDVPPLPPKLERQNAEPATPATKTPEKPPVEIPVATLADGPKKRKKRKTGAKNYTVGVPSSHDSEKHSVVHVSRSGPKSALSSGVRQLIKSVPLNTPTKVWVKSGTHYHEYEVSRDYENPKHRRFKVGAKKRSVTRKQAKDLQDIPAWLRN